MPFLLLDFLFLKTKYKHDFSPGPESGLSPFVYTEQGRHPVVEILLISLFFFSPNPAKNMIEIELFIDYFSYQCLDCFSKVICHIVEISPPLPFGWSLPQMRIGVGSVFTIGMEVIAIQTVHPQVQQRQVCPYPLSLDSRVIYIGYKSPNIED